MKTLVLAAGLTASALGAEQLTLSNVTVTEVGAYVSPDSKLCEGFRLNEKEAVAFFGKAVAVTGEQLHDYSWLPCFVRGRATSSAGAVTWEIQPLGTGHITLPNGTTQSFADQAQKDKHE